MAHDSRSAPGPNADPDSDGFDYFAFREMRERQLHGSIILPTDGPPTVAQMDEVRAAFRDQLERSGLGVEQAAHGIEYSSATLYGWINGTYEGNLEKITRRVNVWIERESRRAAHPSRRTFVSTRVAQDIRTWINLADSERMMCVIVGPSGCGKTLVLQAVRDELNALYVSLEDSMAPIAFMRRIADGLGMTNVGRTKDELHLSVVRRLQETGKIVIIDEAQHLQTKTLSTIRSIHDQSGAVIVMAGSADFLDRIDDRADGRGQFVSRCTCLDLARSAAGTGGRDDAGRQNFLFSIEEVKAFFDKRAIRLGREALDLLWAIACLPNWGSFRVMARVASIAGQTCPDRMLTRNDVRGILNVFMPRDLGAIESLARVHLQRATPSRSVAAIAS